MSDKKNIDRLFQEKFKEFEVSPNDAIWDRIEERLEKKNKKRRVIPFWWQLGGVAAALLLLFALGKGLFNDDKVMPEVVDTEKPSIIDSQKNNNLNDLYKTNSVIVNNTNSTSEDTNELASEDISAQENITTSNNNSETNKIKHNTKQNYTSASNVATETLNKKDNTRAKLTKAQNNTVNTSIAANSKNKKKTIENSNQLKSKSEIETLIKQDSKINAVADNTTHKEQNNTDIKTNDDSTKELLELNDDLSKSEQTIEEAIAEAKNLNEKEEEKLRRWSIAPNVAPVYFSSLNGGSSIDEQFTNNNTNSSVSMSYGVNGSYAINKRLRLKTGVHRVSLNNITNDIIAQSSNGLASRNTSAMRMENVTLKNNASNNSLIVLSRTNLNTATVPESINTLPTGSLEQRFGFIEVPLELEYRVIDKKIGVNVVGGFSTLFLNENEIFADVNGQFTSIGEANNFNDTSFSANFGIGVDYSLSKKLNINLEPKFKYQINTFNNVSGEFRPFFIGVYTGLSFKF